MNSKSRNLQKILTYLNGIVTSTFNFGTAGLFVSLLFIGRAGVFPTVFVLYLTDLPYKPLS